jgi:hypothetical protein
MGFEMPPETVAHDGRGRRVGFEIEYAGVSIADAAEAVRGLFGGRVSAVNRYQWRVTGTRLGEFRVELDSAVLKEKSYEHRLRSLGIDMAELAAQDELEEAIVQVASTFVPFEVATPPLPLEELEAVEQLREALRRLRARGTRDGLLYAFGLHVNPEAASLGADWLVRVLRAFVLLHDWIAAESPVDLSRRVTTFVSHYPDGYAARVADPDYAPDVSALVDDYLHDNPTRNRALDMLPVLAWLDAPRVHAAVDSSKPVRARPALHYRMPNCLVDDPSWRVAEEWNRWVQVERLAAGGERLGAAARAYLEARSSPWQRLHHPWHEQVKAWIA